MKPQPTKNKLEVTTPTERGIVMTRVFDAPRRLVFDAFTKPELVRRWLLGPEGWAMPVCEIDLKVGGSFHYVWRNEADGRQFGMTGVYREVAPVERTVHIEKFDDAWYPGEAEVTSTFVEGSGSTTVTLATLYESREARDAAIETGMADGVAASYDRLATIVESVAA